MAKVFIGMTAYNGERFIDQAIKSFINQSFSDWKLFISDDCSDDATPSIYRSWAEKDSRITYFRQPKNIGMFPNFKFVLDQANSEYFMWASQDDFWERDFLKICINHLETNKNIGFAMTTVADIDSFGRTLREMPEMQIFSGRRSLSKICRYILQPEILGRCNMMYSVFRTNVMRKMWQVFPQRHVWGSDYLYVLAGLSRFDNIVDKQVLFKKRYGGFSSKGALDNDNPNWVRKVEYEKPKNFMFPFGRFNQYFKGHMEALNGTPYRPIVALLLFIRLPRSLFIHFKQKLS